MSSPQRYPTTDEIDYERRKAAGFPGLGVPGNQSKGVVSELQTQFAVEGNDTSAYIGVTSERMTYANETEKPLAATEGTESDREHRLLDQPLLVAPSEPTPEVKQTAGGGSTQEITTTALSGEKLSSEIAKPTETETVEVPTTDGGTAQLDQGVSGGSTGTTVSEDQKGEQVVAPAASSSVAEAGVVEADEPTTEPTPTPTPTKKASAVKTPNAS